MKYLNNNNSQYILSFLKKEFENNIRFFESDICKSIHIDPEITIISTMQTKGILSKQLENINSNIIYIKHYELNQTLSNISTKYCLILNSYDALIVDNLDSFFINKFLDFNVNFIFAGNQVPIPNIEIESLNNLFNLNYFKFLNSGLVFGYTEHLIDLYKNLEEFKYDMQHFFTDYPSSNYITRIFLNKKYLNFSDYASHIDSSCKLFSTIYSPYSYIEEDLNFRYIKTRYPYKSLIIDD